MGYQRKYEMNVRTRYRSKNREELLAYARKHIAKYAMPYDIEFRKELPKTLVGKVAYRVLEEEELEKYKAEQEAAKAEETK